MKQVIIWSRSPKETQQILSGKQTAFLSKTMPKIKLPCEVYLRCTYGCELFNSPTIHIEERKLILADYKVSSKTIYPQSLNGKIVAKFTLNRVDVINGSKDCTNELYRKSCLSYSELFEYSPRPVPIYALNIDNLVIFERPMELAEFAKVNWRCGICDNFGGASEKHCQQFLRFDTNEITGCFMKITKAPQSFMYAWVQEEEKIDGK